ncbi:MAG: hypothetical protein EBV92_07430, partial [Betaproteobacteria bacterium]|nr:hypothetical protein [Betaproteobacteria bacterium]
MARKTVSEAGSTVFHEAAGKRSDAPALSPRSSMGIATSFCVGASRALIAQAWPKPKLSARIS